MESVAEHILFFFSCGERIIQFIDFNFYTSIIFFLNQLYEPPI